MVMNGGDKIKDSPRDAGFTLFTIDRSRAKCQPVLTLGLEMRSSGAVICSTEMRVLETRGTYGR
jgi:hypothetical protein